MRPHQRSLLLILTLAALSIVAGTLADLYSWDWMGDWLAPLLTLLYLITLITFVSRPTTPATTPLAHVRRWAQTAALAAPIWCFLTIEIDSDAPVTLRLLGLTWTMSGAGATRLLTLGGVGIGALAVALAWRTQRQNTKASTPPNG